MIELTLEEWEEEKFIHDMYLPVMKVFGQEGWDDPAMDIYNDCLKDALDLS